MSDPLPSDSLRRLKARAELSLQLGKGTNADASMVLALVECAEIVHTDYLLLSPEQQMKALKALKELGL